MGKRALLFVLILGAIFVFFKFCNSRPEKEQPETKPEPLAVGETSGAFNESFQTLLSSYYALKNSFVSADTAAVNGSARQLLLSADSLKVNEIAGDTSGMIRETANVFAQTITASSNALVAEGDITAKRREFEMITDALWSLTRTVQYGGQKVYYLYCATAFDNRGAYWLSNSAESKNPYGNNGPVCAQVADSIDYSKR